MASPAAGTYLGYLSRMFFAWADYVGLTWQLERQRKLQRAVFDNVASSEEHKADIQKKVEDLEKILSESISADAKEISARVVGISEQQRRGGRN